MFKRRYYIVTSGTSCTRLQMYYMGKHTKKGLEAYIKEKLGEFPILFLVLTGRQLREVAHNVVQEYGEPAAAGLDHHMEVADLSRYGVACKGGTN